MKGQDSSSSEDGNDAQVPRRRWRRWAMENGAGHENTGGGLVEVAKRGKTKAGL
jgi:hypothetical protein